jgi:hypothetical protein
VGGAGGSADVDPPAGRAAFHGAVIGFVLVAAGMTWLGVAAGVGLGGAIGLGAFVGAWGGVGFGGMLGATLCITRADDARIAAEQERRKLPMPASVEPTTVTSDPTGQVVRHSTLFSSIY